MLNAFVSSYIAHESVATLVEPFFNFASACLQEHLVGPVKENEVTSNEEVVSCLHTGAEVWENECMNLLCMRYSVSTILK